MAERLKSNHRHSPNQQTSKEKPCADLNSHALTLGPALAPELKGTQETSRGKKGRDSTVRGDVSRPGPSRGLAQGGMFSHSGTEITTLVANSSWLTAVVEDHLPTPSHLQQPPPELTILLPDLRPLNQRSQCP